MNNYIIINLLRAGGDCGPQRVENVAELVVFGYFSLPVRSDVRRES